MAELDRKNGEQWIDRVRWLAEANFPGSELVQDDDVGEYWIRLKMRDSPTKPGVLERV